jgi:hypothetical protein
MGFFKKVGKTMRILESQTYKDTIKSAERVAQGTYQLLAEKSPEEVNLIGGRASDLSIKIQEIVSEEQLLVAGLALLTALRVLDQHVQQQAEDLRARR